MDKKLDDGMKVVSSDAISITDFESGEVIEKRNGKPKQEMIKNEKR